MKTLDETISAVWELRFLWLVSIAMILLSAHHITKLEAAVAALDRAAAVQSCGPP